MNRLTPLMLIGLLLAGCGKSAEDWIVGTWLCPNQHGYVQYIEYKPSGQYIEYEMGYTPGVPSPNIEAVGAWEIKGDILLASKYGYKQKIKFKDHNSMSVSLISVSAKNSRATICERVVKK